MNQKYKNDLKVAVCIPTYNREETVIEAINSVPEDSGNITFEIIVYDNASTDRSIDKIMALNNKRVVIIKSNKNYGFVWNINRCLNTVGEYDWILMLHSDDVLAPRGILEMAQLCQIYPNVGMVFGRSIIIGDIYKAKATSEELINRGDEGVSFFQTAIACSGVFYNKRKLVDLKKYSTKYPYSADEEFNARDRKSVV